MNLSGLFFDNWYSIEGVDEMYVREDGMYVRENCWFNKRQEPVDLLSALLVKQPELSELKMIHCDLTDEQQEQIRAAVINDACSIQFEE